MIDSGLRGLCASPSMGYCVLLLGKILGFTLTAPLQPLTGENHHPIQTTPRRLRQEARTRSSSFSTCICSQFSPFDYSVDGRPFEDLTRSCMSISIQLNEFNILRSLPHYAGGIWKRRLHPENITNVFPPHYDRWRNLKIKQSPVILHLCLIATPSFTKISFSSLTIRPYETQSRRFQIPLVEERFRKLPFS